MLQEIKLTELFPSPTNPRKTFDQVKLQELADSISKVGLIQPITVRPHHNGTTTYEVIAGERRYRAAAIAKSETIECVVRELSDVEVLEIQTIENLQRDDLHELEEADGYARLMKEAGYDVARIAQRVGKSEKYVYDRIKLLQLIPELREIFLAGEIAAGHAILLARLTPSEQKNVLGDSMDFQTFRVNGLFQPDHGRDDETADLELDDTPAPRKAVSVRELARYIDEHVRFRPEQVDTQALFPETAAALATAAEEDLKVVKITRSYRVTDDAKEEKERTFGSPSWKRADGQPEEDPYSGEPGPTKTCEHSVLGLVVAGRGRGESFKVCVAKKKCATHWSEEMKKAKREATRRARTSGTDAERGERERNEREAREQEDQRWKKAFPKLQQAFVEGIRRAKISILIDAVVEDVEPWQFRNTKTSSKLMTKGKTAEDAIRFLAFMIWFEAIEDSVGPRDFDDLFKKLGIDAKKIVDQVAPKEKPKAEKKPAPAGSKKKPVTKARKKAAAKA
ncbi:MAG: ParB/RepB/Spo0J family partition protein [Vicinamibacterales bacterium]